MIKKTIKLPPPQTDLDYPLMKALENRRSIRKWTDDPISEQDLSNLLWAACGQTLAPKGKAKSKRTAPSGCNSQEIRVYVLLENGVFHYDEVHHSLVQIIEDDIREDVGTQKMMQSAPLGIVFVADLTRMTSPHLKRDDAKQFNAWVDTGYISQNIYLYCAAANMATCALGLIDRKKLRELLPLQEHEKIVLDQVVGYRID